MTSHLSAIGQLSTGFNVLGSGGTAGSGGGGRGCPAYEYNVYSNGTDGLGGGGGGTYVSKDARNTAYGRGGSGVVILRYDAPTILVSARQFNVTGSGNLLVMEVQT